MTNDNEILSEAKEAHRLGLDAEADNRAYYSEWFNEKLIISRAHEVVQKTPLTAKLYSCVRCGHEGLLDDLFGENRCLPHLELESSGWLAE